MQPYVTMITLGVDDLERSLAFYRDGLGFPSEGIVGTEFDHGAVAFFQLEHGLQLVLWERGNIAWDAGIELSPPSPADFTIAHNVRSRQEVDDVMAQAATAGATISKSPTETFYGGYAGYFQDPDGHLWEVAWNPQLLPE